MLFLSPHSPTVPILGIAPTDVSNVSCGANSKNLAGIQSFGFLETFGTKIAFDRSRLTSFLS